MLFRSTMRSSTRLTFRSESSPKSVSTNGAAGGLRGRSPEVSVSSHSAGSKLDGARLFREAAAEGSGEEQRESGGSGARGVCGVTVVAGDGGSSSSREEHRGEDRKLSSFEWRWEGWDWSDWEGGEGTGKQLTGDWRSDLEAGRDSEKSKKEKEGSDRGLIEVRTPAESVGAQSSSALRHAT